MEWMDEEAINTTIEEKNTGVTTGTAPSDVINNVYDLYGGCYEYLLEANDTIYRGSRGGNRGYSVPPFRQGKIIPTDNHGNVASRMSIYIK